MPERSFRLQDYASYLAHVGEAAHIDITRRADPARMAQAWDNLRAVARGAYLRLQDHGADVWFRSIRWRTIPPEAELERYEFTPMPIPEEALRKERERVERMLKAKRKPKP